MRKIAVPVNGENVHAHFGGAPFFKFYSIEDDKIVNTELVVPPNHEPGVLPRWMQENGVTDLILVGIGARAVNILQQLNIQVAKGVGEENADEVVKKYIAGTLDASGENCKHDDGDHSNRPNYGSNKK